MLPFLKSNRTLIQSVFLVLLSPLVTLAIVTLLGVEEVYWLIFWPMLVIALAYVAHIYNKSHPVVIGGRSADVVASAFTYTVLTAVLLGALFFVFQVMAAVGGATTYTFAAVCSGALTTTIVSVTFLSGWRK